MSSAALCRLRDAEPPRQNSGHGRPGFSPHKITEVGRGRNYNNLPGQAR